MEEKFWNYALVILLHFTGICASCFFPPEVTSSGSQPWVGRIHRKEGQGELLLYFKENKLSGFVHTGAKANTLGPEAFGVATFNRTCVNSVSLTKFLVTHEEADKRPRYMCMEIVIRSKGIFQLKVSKLTNHIEPLLCYTATLTLDPWMYVSFNILKTDHQLCGFSGGFNMKVRSPDGTVFGCNSMDLPMRLESECIGGDGVRFQFRYETCKESLPMDVDQRGYCVGSWIDGRFTYSVLRKVGHDDLWCLRTPLIRSRNFTAVLFLDAMCSSEEKLNTSVNFVSLNLVEAHSDELCDDEYPGCSEKRCTPYTEQSCQKSCGLCHAQDLMTFCKFPRLYRGEWLQKNFHSHQQIKISSSKITVQNVGTFKCVQGGRPTEGVDKKYALVSTFSNGCRPRFTCVAFRRFGHSVLAYTLGNSISWPFPPRTNVPEAVCEDSIFSMDPNPIRDSYRGNINTFKSIVSRAKYKTPVTCRVSQAFRLTGSFNRNESCQGSLYEDCNDPTRLRMEVKGCGLKSATYDFQCLAIYEGRYWENITVLQNLDDPMDARCMVLNDVRAGEMIMMSASECDKQSWLWASSGKRSALGKFHYQLEDYPCKVVPTRPPTTPKIIEEVTYRIATSAKPASKPTDSDKYSNDGESSASKSATRLGSPPTESLSKGSSLKSDNKGVVQASGQGDASSPATRVLELSVMTITAFLLIFILH